MAAVSEQQDASWVAPCFPQLAHVERAGGALCSIHADIAFWIDDEGAEEEEKEAVSSGRGIDPEMEANTLADVRAFAGAGASIWGGATFPPRPPPSVPST